MSNQQPYDTPEAELVDDKLATMILATTPKLAPVGSGYSWIKNGFNMITAHFWQWFLAGIVFLLLVAGLYAIPIVGSIASMFIQPLLLAGLAMGCAAQAQGKAFSAKALQYAFQPYWVQISMLAIIFFLVQGVNMIVGFFMLGFDLEALQRGEIVSTIQPFMGILSALIFLMISVLISSVYFSSIYLITYHQMGIGQALMRSIKGSFINVLPLTLFWVGMVFALILLCIPLGLGLIVYFPLCITSSYFAYKAIYVD